MESRPPSSTRSARGRNWGGLSGVARTRKGTRRSSCSDTPSGKRASAAIRRSDAKAPRVVLVNEAFAARYLKGSDAVGRQLRFGDAKAAPSEIIGVVASVMNEGMDGMEEPGVYFPFAQIPALRTLVIRAPGVHTRIAPAVREILAALDPRLPLSEVKAMEQI